MGKKQVDTRTLVEETRDHCILGQAFNTLSPPFLMHLITYCIFYCIKQMPVQYRETKYIFFIVIKSTLNGGKR